MFAEDISEDISDLTFTGFYSISGYLRNLRGRLLSSETFKFSEVFTLCVFTLKPFPEPGVSEGVSHGVSPGPCGPRAPETPRRTLPRTPSQRARGSKKFILARTHEKAIPPRTKFSFSLEIFILGLKFSFSIENFNPRPCFAAAREGPGMKISFSIENFIPYRKLDFFNIASRDWFFQSWGPLGWFSATLSVTLPATLRARRTRETPVADRGVLNPYREFPPLREGWGRLQWTNGQNLRCPNR